MKRDAELITDALTGGPEAFAPIVRRYQDAVFAVALARLGDFHEAEDVAQGVFVAAFERLGNLKDPSRLGAWLRSVTIHHCIDRLRRRRATRSLEHMDKQPGSSPAPEAELERREFRDQVLAAIARLSKVQRETTTLYYINGYSIGEVARMQEVPVGTVKRRLHDARGRLKEEMLHMVEDVLKSESPKEDFAQRVFEMLWRLSSRDDSQPIPWAELVSELKKIGSRGIQGFVKALQSPYSPTRATAMGLIRTCESADTKEIIVGLLKSALDDPNKKVRRNAVDVILRIDVSAERRRQEFMPLVVERLSDASKRVRRRAAYCLSLHAADVDWRVAARALLEEQDPKTRWFMRWMLRAVLEAQAGQATSS
jgi:RNA polymerase sigma-70 factor (ECF subfamily)